MFAVRTPNTPIPTSIRSTPTTLPIGEMGTTSPYPTVVIVAIAHQMTVPQFSIPPSVPRSTIPAIAVATTITIAAPTNAQCAARLRRSCAKIPVAISVRRSGAILTSRIGRRTGTTTMSTSSGCSKRNLIRCSDQPSSDETGQWQMLPTLTTSPIRIPVSTVVR